MASGRHNGSLTHSPYENCPTEKSFIVLKNKIKGNYIIQLFKLSVFVSFVLLTGLKYIYFKKKCVVLEFNITLNVLFL